MAAEDRWLELVLQRAAGVVWETNLELRFTRVVSGHSLPPSAPDQMVGKTVQEVFGSQGPAELTLAHHQGALAGQSQSFRHWLWGRHFDVQIEPRVDHQGTVIGCIGVAVDVTEKARLEESQRVAHVGSFEWDVEGNAVTWSDELHRIYGVPREQFTGRYESFISSVYRPDLESTVRLVQNALRDANSFTYDHRIVRQDGSVRTLHTSGQVIRGEGGKPIRMVGSCWDATELMEKTHRLDRTIAHLQAIIRATADGLLAVDATGTVALFNEQFTRMWRIPADLVSKGDDSALLTFVLDQLEKPEDFMQGVRALYERRDATSFDVLRFKDGRVFERYSAPEWIGEEIVGRVWSFRDVTLRDRAERQAKEAIGILGIAAHDLRNPLGGLRLRLDGMERMLAGGELSREALAAQIRSCQKFITRGSELLTTLLDVAQIGADKLAFSHEPVELVELTREIVTRSDDEIKAAGCDVTVHAGAAVEGDWDRNRLDQVVTNLLTNALKYGHGKPIEIDVARGDATGLWTIRDHGIGISTEDQERIFKQFERAVATGRGVGLGLWIVNKFVAKLGGKVSVESNMGEGTTFRVELPLRGTTNGEAHGGDPGRR